MTERMGRKKKARESLPTLAKGYKGGAYFFCDRTRIKGFFQKRKEGEEAVGGMGRLIRKGDSTNNT